MDVLSDSSVAHFVARDGGAGGKPKMCRGTYLCVTSLWHFSECEIFRNLVRSCLICIFKNKIIAKLTITLSAIFSMPSKPSDVSAASMRTSHEMSDE